MLAWMNNLGPPLRNFDGSLGLHWDLALERVGRKLRFLPDRTQWSVDEWLIAKRMIASGERLVLYNEDGHEWTFTRRVQVFTLWATLPVTAGLTVVGAPSLGRTLVTCSSAKFYDSMVGKSIVVTGSGTYVIDQYVSSTQVYVDTEATFAASTFSIASDGDYVLPLDFYGLDSDLYYLSSSRGWDRVRRIGTERILYQRQMTQTTSDPWSCAVEANHGKRNVGQRNILMVYPTPSSDVNVQMRYNLAVKGVSRQRPFYMGGDPMSEVFIAGAEAACEREMDERADVSTEYFQRRLSAAILIDSKQRKGHDAGVMEDPSDGEHEPNLRDVWSSGRRTYT